MPVIWQTSPVLFNVQKDTKSKFYLRLIERLWNVEDYIVIKVNGVSRRVAFYPVFSIKKYATKAVEAIIIPPTTIPDIIRSRLRFLFISYYFTNQIIIF